MATQPALEQAMQEDTLTKCVSLGQKLLSPSMSLQSGGGTGRLASMKSLGGKLLRPASVIDQGAKNVHGDPLMHDEPVVELQKRTLEDVLSTP